MNVIVIITSLEIDKKFIIAIVNFSNLLVFILMFQFNSLILRTRVDNVIRVYMNTVINVNTIITVGKKIILFCNNTWIVNHFGINPKNGGIPLNDKKFRIKNIFVIIFVFIVW